MNKLLIYTIFLALFVSCNNNTQESAQGDDNNSNSEKSESEKKTTKRDYSITAANAYTDLFLDSLAVENFIATEKVNDTLTRRIRSFYNARNYQFAWFSSDGVTEQGRSFWNLHEYFTTYSNDSSLTDKALRRKMNALVAEEELKVSGSDKSTVTTEVKLTQHFIQYVLNNYKQGEIKRKEMERFVPLKKEDAMFLADSLLTKKHKDNKYYADVNPAYKSLKDQLQKYYDIAKKGGWQPIITTEKKIMLNASSPTVLAIKKRLQVTGELAAGDTTPIFNNELESAVKKYQTSIGLTADGIVTPTVIKDLNVPAEKRVQQILINMGRMRWMLNPTEGNLMVVNIPEFVLHVYEGQKKAFDMNVVVGKEGHNTTIFTGNLNQVVFSPYWNVPESIVRDEILPGMARDGGYLERHNMEIVSNDGELPTVRQRPGLDNSLGKVKFLFPNSFDIYFHDTPSKSLFNKDKRAYSHGCIRLSDPVKMANYVLRNQPEWTPEKIDEAMNSEEEKAVRVKDPIPVLITYYTAWVDENGVLNFRDDIYSHDVVVAKKMFTNPM